MHCLLVDFSPASKPSKKKVKGTSVNKALLPGWEKVFQGPSDAYVPTPRSRASQSSTPLSSVPPSSNGDTSESEPNDLAKAGGFTDTTHDRYELSADEDSTHLSDLRDALRYRERDPQVQAAEAAGSASRGRNTITVRYYYLL